MGSKMLEYIALGVVGVGALGVFSCFSTYNRMMALDERCNTSFADIDALLTHRHDLIPGLVQSVQSVVGQERYYVDTVMNAYREVMSSNKPLMRLKAEENLGSSINDLFAGLARMPNMNTSSHFTELRNSFKDVENRITAARRYYNNTVEEHNATLRQFPANMIGSKMRVYKRNPYSLGAERILKQEAVSLHVSV